MPSLERLPSVSVVVATFNRGHQLREVLAPLLADPAATEVIVVVDGSRDGSIELLEEMAGGEPRLRPHVTENRGAVNAQQTGVELATGQVVLVVDDDVVAEPGLVSGHARHHASEDGLVVVGYMPTPRPPRRPGSFPSQLYHEIYEYRRQAWEADPEAILLGLWGGNVSLDRAALLCNGGIAGSHVLPYHYDLELGLRLHRAGLRGRFDPELRALHRHERSYESFLRESRAQGRALHVIEQLHGDLLPVDHGRERIAHRSWLHAFVRLTDRPRLRRLVRRSLDALVRCAGTLHLLWLERKAALLLGHVARRRGEVEQSRASSAPASAPTAPRRSG